MTALGNLHATFRRWFGEDYDLDAIDAVLAAAAVIRLDGDPLWIMLVGGPGNAKTETVAALSKSGAFVTSTIQSEGALLSATSKGERAADASGGLLMTIGKSGVLVIKDFTSILSMSRTNRPLVLAALREVYDGQWSRNVGADGGRTLEWDGRIALIGAVTTAWDTAHAVIAEMGDRFVLVRLDSTENRLSGGRQAIENTGQEKTMRAELAASVESVLASMNTTPIHLTEYERETLLRAADLVTRARTPVMRDTRGNVMDAHASEMPTRFAKQLTQVVRGGVAIGMTRDEAMGLAIRCARDSVPPLRLDILAYLADHPRSLVSDVRKRLDKPHNTIDRELQGLHMLGLVSLKDENEGSGVRWRYTLRSDVDTSTLFPEMSVPPHPLIGGSSDKTGNAPKGCSDKPGNGPNPSLLAAPQAQPRPTHGRGSPCQWSGSRNRPHATSATTLPSTTAAYAKNMNTSASKTVTAQQE